MSSDGRLWCSIGSSLGYILTAWVQASQWSENSQAPVWSNFTVGKVFKWRIHTTPQHLQDTQTDNHGLLFTPLSAKADWAGGVSDLAGENTKNKRIFNTPPSHIPWDMHTKWMNTKFVLLTVTTFKWGFWNCRFGKDKYMYWNPECIWCLDHGKNISDTFAVSWLRVFKLILHKLVSLIIVFTTEIIAKTFNA